MASSDQELLDFRHMLLAEVNERRGGGIGKGLPEFSATAFTSICTEWLDDTGLVENPSPCQFETLTAGRIARADAYGVSDDESVVDIFVTCFDGGHDLGLLTPDEARRAARQGKRVLESASRALLDTLDPSDSGNRDMIERIVDVAPGASRFRVFVITDQRCSLVELDTDVLSGRELQYEIVDIERLHRLLQAGLEREEIVVDFTEHHQAGLACLHAPEISEDYDAYLALVPGEILYKLYDRHGPRLLERNVRSFLQARGKINRGIRDTLRRDPDRFLAFNNGIVATVDEISVRHDPDTGSRHITAVRGLQIVNGGQTTASIHRARRDDKVDLSSVYVPAKISLIRADLVEEMVPAISLFANSQNNIQMADFSANHPWHVRMAQLSAQIWCPGERGRWFYERTRGEYEVERSRTARTTAQLRQFNERTPRSRKFDKVEMAKFLLAWEQRPDKVSLGGQKSFSFFMQNLAETHAKDHVPSETDFRRAVAKAILYRQALAITRQEAFPAYRAQVAAYLVSYLSHRTGRQVNLDTIWTAQALSDDLTSLLRNWAYQVRDAIVSSANGRNVTEWCKKEDCWRALRAKDFGMPDSLPDEINGTASAASSDTATVDLSPADLDAIHRCQQISAQDWIRISQWGAETGILKTWQSGIAATLGGYAAQDWAKQPSPKQAKRGVEMLKIVQDEGGPVPASPGE